MFPSAKRRIFVVDDDIHLMNGIKDILELEDYVVMAAQDSQAALLVVDDFYPDMLVIGIWTTLYPTQRDLINHCRYRYPVLCLSIRNDIKRLPEYSWLTDEGELLSKPFDAEDLVDAVARIIARRDT